MSLASMASIERCTWIGTPLASSSGPADSPTISMWNGARAGALDGSISAVRVHHVVDAGQRGDHRIGQRQQRDVARGSAASCDGGSGSMMSAWRGLRRCSGTNGPILGDFSSAVNRGRFATMGASFNRSMLQRKEAEP